MANLGLELWASTPQECSVIQAEIDKMGRLVKTISLQPD
jgi:hypothetical protein